jgi:poly-gamma-glutamate system protein
MRDFGLRISDCRFKTPIAEGPYRPQKGILRLSIPRLVAFSALVLAAAIFVERSSDSWPWRGMMRLSPRVPQAEVVKKARAAKQSMQLAEALLREAKRAAGIQGDQALSPADSSLIGDELTPLVTTLGGLEAKRIASNPDWARVLTLRLYNSGVHPGGVVAAGCSGSFPGLNLALAAACQALDAELIAVSSVTASTWGANQPGFTWPEIEAQLVRAGLIRRISVAISMGGQKDIALDLEPSARMLARRIQESSAAELGASLLSPATLQESVLERLRIYRQHARGRRIALYVNIGGNVRRFLPAPKRIPGGKGFRSGAGAWSHRSLRRTGRADPVIAQYRRSGIALGSAEIARAFWPKPQKRQINEYNVHGQLGGDPFADIESVGWSPKHWF